MAITVTTPGGKQYELPDGTDTTELEAKGFTVQKPADDTPTIPEAYE